MKEEAKKAAVGIHDASHTSMNESEDVQFYASHLLTNLWCAYKQRHTKGNSLVLFYKNKVKTGLEYFVVVITLYGHLVELFVV